MTLVKWAVTHVAPLFIVTSPVTSYADQIWSMSKKRSSAGFSLDIPLIMLVASILKYVIIVLHMACPPHVCLHVLGCSTGSARVTTRHC
jgi:hypothetical protein